MDSIELFIFDTCPIKLLINSFALSKSENITLVGNSFMIKNIKFKLLNLKPEIILVNSECDIEHFHQILAELNKHNYYPKVLFYGNSSDLTQIIDCDYNWTQQKFVLSILLNGNCLKKLSQCQAA